MKIAIGSKNPTKIKAVEEAFKIILHNTKYELISLDSASGVSKQPMTEKETIKGAYNRAYEALNQTKADIAVGLEAGIEKIEKNYYTSGWVVIITKNKKISSASTIRMIVPLSIMKIVKKGNQLGEATDIFFKTKNASKSMGYFGLMTDKLITRSQAYKDAIIVAYKYLFHV